MTSHRPRRLGLVVAALLVSAPAVWTGGAHAAESDTVTFQGGCALQLLGPLGSVDPSPARVVVDAGEQVRFVNRLSGTAVLSFDGEAAVELPSGGSAKVVFHDGPITAALTADCVVGEVSGATTVEVRASDAPMPPPSSGQPAPPGSPEQPGAQPSPDGPDASAPPAGGGQRDGEPAPAPGDRSGTGGRGDPAAQQSYWRQGSEAGAPAASSPVDTPPDEATMPRWNMQSESDNGGETATGADTVDASEQPAPTETDPGTETEQLSHAAGSRSGGGPNGMLALIATVCVAGVTAGAIRAIIAQRTARTEWA